MSKLLYFAYGSNLHPLWLRSRTPSAEILGMECLSYFNLHFNKHGLDNSGKCNIVASDDSEDVVYGVVYEFRADEKDVLDEAERGYEQEIINIGDYENVLVYIAPDPVEGYLAPHSWYRDIVIAGAELHQFPQTYVAHIKSFNPTVDLDEEREHRCRTIVWPDQKY